MALHTPHRRSTGSPRDLLLSPLRDGAGFAASPVLSPATTASPAAGSIPRRRDSAPPLRARCIDLGPLGAAASARSSAPEGGAGDDDAASAVADTPDPPSSLLPALLPTVSSPPSSVASGVLDAVLEDARAQRAAAERALAAASRERRDADTLAAQAASEGAAIAGAARAADAQARLEDALAASEARVGALEARLRSAGVPLPTGVAAPPLLPPRHRPTPGGSVAASLVAPVASMDPFDVDDEDDGASTPPPPSLAAADDRLKASMEARRRLASKLAREQVRSARLRNEAGRLSTALAAAEGARAAAAVRADAAAAAADAAVAEADAASRAAALEDLVAALRDQVAALGGGELGRRLEAEAVARATAEDRAAQAEAELAAVRGEGVGDDADALLALPRVAPHRPPSRSAPASLTELWRHLEDARAAAEARARDASDARAALEALRAAHAAERGPLVVEVGGRVPAPGGANAAVPLLAPPPLASAAVTVTVSPTRCAENDKLARLSGAASPSSGGLTLRRTLSSTLASFATVALRSVLAAWRAAGGNGGASVLALALAVALGVVSRGRRLVMVRGG